MPKIRYVNQVDIFGDGAHETDTLLALFFLAWRGFVAEADALLEPHGLGRLHHRILYAVVRLPGVGIGDLAATLGITRQALHGPLAELERRRLVVRKVSKESARERALFVTKGGASLEDAASSAQRAQLERVFAQLGPEAAKGWSAVMRALAAEVTANLPRVLPPPRARRRRRARAAR